jgi:hypothetical protein
VPSLSNIQPRGLNFSGTLFIDRLYHRFWMDFYDKGIASLSNVMLIPVSGAIIFSPQKSEFSKTKN